MRTGGKSLVRLPVQRRHSLLKARLLKPFLQRYKIRYAILQEPEELRDVFANCLMTGDKKLLFMKNSKAGCTSVAQLLVQYSTGHFSKDVHWHSDGVFQHLFSFPDIRSAFDDPDTFCFSMTRNPLKRLLSGFSNFFVDRRNRAMAKYLPAIKARGFIDGGDIDRNFEVFVDFVEESMSESRLACDRHWREQHLNIGYGKLPYDYVAKLESYSEDIPHIFERAGVGDYLDKVDWRQVHNRSNNPGLVVPARLGSRIEQIYARDYELFGY